MIPKRPRKPIAPAAPVEPTSVITGVAYFSPSRFYNDGITIEQLKQKIQSHIVSEGGICKIHSVCVICWHPANHKPQNSVLKSGGQIQISGDRWPQEALDFHLEKGL